MQWDIKAMFCTDVTIKPPLLFLMFQEDMTPMHLSEYPYGQLPPQQFQTKKINIDSSIIALG